MDVAGYRHVTIRMDKCANKETLLRVTKFCFLFCKIMRPLQWTSAARRVPGAAGDSSAPAW
jgi:hypothetical protein